MKKSLVTLIAEERQAASLSGYYDGTMDTGRDYLLAKKKTDKRVKKLQTAIENEEYRIRTEKK